MNQNLSLENVKLLGLIEALKSVFKYTVVGNIEAIEASKVFKAIDALNLTIPTLIK
jgi:hypothetical protein